MFSALVSTRRTLGAVGLVVLVPLSACTTTGISEEASPPALAFTDEETVTTTVEAPAAPADTTTTTAAPTSSCIGSTFSVNYPASWFVGSPSSTETCRYLSRQQIEPTLDGKYQPEITFMRERRYRDALNRVSDFAGNATSLVDSRASDVNGYPATVFDVVSNGQGSTREGLRTRVVVVNLDSRALVATATEATVGAPAGDYGETLDVLDRILDTLIVIE